MSGKAKNQDAAFALGQRVANQSGEIGHIEADELTDNDPIFVDMSYVRWLTPDNNPSCCCSTCWTRDLTVVPDSVVPMKRNAAWWAEARALHAAVEGALIEADL